MPKLSKLLSPWKIGKLEIKNRMVMAPMTPVWCNPDETPSDRQIAYWTERAKCGVGLITTEVNSVDALHRYQPLSSGLHSDFQIETHKRLTDAVHQYGARIFPQLCHGGAKALSSVTGVQPVSSSDLPVKVADIPRPITREEMLRAVDSFAAAA